MSSEIIVACITGGLTFLGIVVTNLMSNRKVESSLDKQQAITDTKIEELTREVRLHNNFAQRVPVIEEKIDNFEKRLSRLEK